MTPGTCLPRFARAIAAGVLVLHVMPATAATLRPGFTERRIATGLSRATAMALAPDGRIFVCEQNGRLRVVRDGSLLNRPFVTRKGKTAGARGKLGRARTPNIAIKHKLYG